MAKDLFEIAGHTPSFGHPRWRDTHDSSTTTAPAVQALLDAGADLAGMAKMDQLAYSLIGDVGEGRPPVNAADPALFCGGSSSGSAAAVAGGLVDFALGTDTAGSVRVPAAACGLVGIRPTHGAISSHGVLPLAPTFDAVGVLASTPESLAAAMHVLVPGLADKKYDGDVSVHLASDVFFRVDDETAAVARRFADRLATQFGGTQFGGTQFDGTVSDIEFGSFTDAHTGDLFARIQSREIWQHHSEWVTAQGSALAADVSTRLERCRELSGDAPELQDADIAERQAYCDRFDAAVPEGSVIVLPTLPEYGPQRSWTADQLIAFRGGCFRLTAPSSLRGAPQAVWSIRTSTGRSIGLSLLAAPGTDGLLLDAMLALAGT